MGMIMGSGNTMFVMSKGGPMMAAGALMFLLGAAGTLAMLHPKVRK